MALAVVGAWLHRYAPHSSEALYASSAVCAVMAVSGVYLSSRLAQSHKRLPSNWVVTTAAIAAPVPTWVLLIVMPLDADLNKTISNDPVVVALAGLYGLAAAFRDFRAIAATSRKHMPQGEASTED